MHSHIHEVTHADQTVTPGREHPPHLACASEQQARYCLLDVLVAEDGGRDVAADAPVHVRLAGKLAELRLLRNERGGSKALPQLIRANASRRTLHSMLQLSRRLE